MQQSVNEDLCQQSGCEKVSEVGAHGIRDGAVYNEYWCLNHYNKQKDKTDGRRKKPAKKGDLDGRADV